MEYKKDDYLVWTNNTTSYAAKPGFIAKVNSKTLNYVDVIWVTKTSQMDGEYDPEDFRLATQEEINKSIK